MSGARSRTKGKVGEREWAAFLRAHGFAAHRGQQFSGSNESPDVVAPGLPGIHFECKRTEQVSLDAWLKQAKDDAGDKIPVVAHRKNRGGWIIVMDAEQFMRLLK